MLLLLAELVPTVTFEKGSWKWDANCKTPCMVCFFSKVKDLWSHLLYRRVDDALFAPLVDANYFCTANNPLIKMVRFYSLKILLPVQVGCPAHNFAGLQKQL